MWSLVISSSKSTLPSEASVMRSWQAECEFGIADSTGASMLSYMRTQESRSADGMSY